MKVSEFIVVLVLVGLVVVMLGCVGEEPTKVEKSPTPPLAETTTPTVAPTQTPTQTPTPIAPMIFDSKKLKDRIEGAINPSWGYSLKVSNIVYSNEKLIIEYISYETAHDASIYGQMVKVMKIVKEYLEEIDTKPNEIVFRVISKGGDYYELTLTYEELKKFVNAELDFEYWMEHVYIKRY